MNSTYWTVVMMVVAGGVAIIGGIFMGVTPSANFLVEIGFSLFGLAALFFVVSVLIGLLKEFRETA